MHFAPRRRSSASINLTPLIDMMFLLVIFILVASRFEPDSGLALELPRTRTEGGGQSSAAPERVTVTVTKEGEVFIDREQVTVDEFEARLRKAREGMEAGGEEPLLVVRGDVAARHGLVVEVLAAASRVGQKKISISTLPADTP